MYILIVSQLLTEFPLTCVHSHSCIALNIQGDMYGKQMFYQKNSTQSVDF